MSLILANTSYLEEEIEERSKYETIFILFIDAIDALAWRAAGFWTGKFFSTSKI